MILNYKTLKDNITSTEFFRIWFDHLKLLPPERILTTKHPTATPGSLAVMQIRGNALGVANDVIKNNDWLVTLEMRQVPGMFAGSFITMPEVDVYSITLDPRTKRDGMAFQMNQVSLMHVGYHNWNPLRICLRQDNHGPEYRKWARRYYNVGGRNERHKDVVGYFTLHTHDTGGFGNSSLGCAIISNDATYRNYFKPLLGRVVKAKQGMAIPVMNIERDDFIKIMT